MILLGLSDAEKSERIEAYCAANDIEKVFIFAPAKYRLPGPLSGLREDIEWAEIIQYKFYYRLLGEIGPRSLIVINECLRTQNRYDLTYNCLRNYLNQARHQLIFQHLPLIDTVEDFMILFDFDTRSQWKREKFAPALLAAAQIKALPVPVEFRAVPVATSEKLKADYEREKRKLIDCIGLKDPHTIPRNLYLLSGKAKLAHITAGGEQSSANFNLFADENPPSDNDIWYVGRNNRFKLPNLQTYKEPAYPRAPYTVFEWPHNYIDFCDVIALSGQTRFTILTADLKVDEWYLKRYQEWAGRLAYAYANLS
jgi:hypothetical protein